MLSVQKDHVVKTSMAEANALTGADDVHAQGITGDGLTAAIIDTGVDSDEGVVHPALADDLAGQHCFRTENDCIGGVDSAEDQAGHGTHVAGIITGPQGAAPDARFYALKVFTTGDTSDTNILNALDYVVGLNAAAAGTVDLVNMSLGGDNFSTAAACNAANGAYQTVFSTLNAQSVAIFVATGNDAQTNAVGAPACVDGAIGVGSTGDATFTAGFSNCTDNAAADKVSCYSNATNVQGPGELVDLLAPGCRITSTGLDGSTNLTICGTSMATPYAVGSAALVQEYAKAHGGKLSPTALEDLLEATGKPILDYRIGGSASFPRVAPGDAIGSMVLPTPGNLQLTSSTTTSASFSWDAVTGGVDHYQLRRTSATTGATAIVPAPGTGTAFTDTTVPCGPLTYTVQAVNAEGFASQQSNAVAVNLRDCPVAPTGVTLAKDSATSHTVSWTPGDTTSPSVVVQRRTSGGSFADLATVPNPGTTSHSDTIATPCGRVEYRLFTLAANGDRSAASTVVDRSVCAPANDDRANAEVVAVGASGTTVSRTEPNAKYATQEAADPNFSCKFGGSGKGFDGIWYSLTPAAATQVTISTNGTTLTDPAAGVPDTLLGVYNASTLAQVACNDDINGAFNFNSALTTALAAGTTYLVHVAQWTDVPDSAEGVLKTSFTFSTAGSVPANNDYANAAVIGSNPYQLTVPNAQLATLAADDPTHACRTGGAGKGQHTLWWTYTPTESGTLDLDTLASFGSFTDTLLSVYTGTQGSLTSVACNDDVDVSSSILVSEVTDVPVTAGTTYSIMVSRWSATATATAGTVVLSASFSPPAGVTLSETAVAVEEGRPGATYTAVLDKQPTGSVTVTPTGDADCSASAPLTFSKSNWATPQTITVTAVDDGLAEPTETCTITHAATSGDPAYNGVSIASVTGTVTDKLVTSVSLISPAEGASFAKDAVVNADFACSDNRAGAGIASCVGTVADGSPIDTSTVGSHTFTVTLTDVHGGTATETNTYTVTAAPTPGTTGKPDARITQPAPAVGDNVYGGKKQKKKVKAAVKSKVTYVVSLQNDGTGADRLKVLGGKAAKGFKVKYVGPDGKNITKAVVAGTFVTPTLAKNATYDIKVVVKVSKKAEKKLKVSVRATSVATPAASDVVFMLTKRK